MAYTGKGNNGLFFGLESGILKWLEIVGGLGVTVASLPIDADYETLSAATAGDNPIISVIGNTTESSDVSIVNSSGVNIRLLNSSTVNMGSNRFVWADNSHMNITGNGTISFSYSGGESLLEASGNTGVPTLDGIKITNSSSDGYICNTTNGRFSNLDINGDLSIDGTRNSFSNIVINGDIVFAATSDNNQVSNSQFNGTITDSGSGNMLSDILSY